MSSIRADLQLNCNQFLAAIHQVNASIGRMQAVVAVGAGAVFSLQKSFAIVGESIAKAAEMQGLQTSFAVLTGSAIKAQGTLSKLVDFAASTPFELPELATASRQLLAYGFAAEDVVGILRTIGDVASGSGQPIGDLAYLLGSAKTQGRLFQQDINQFTNRGIPIIAELAKVFGVTESAIRDMTSAGEIGFSQVLQAFQNMAGEGGKFTGMMQAQSATWNGRLSALRDNIGAAMRAFGEPIIDSLTPFLAAAVEGAKNFSAQAAVMGNIAVGAIQGLGALAGMANTMAPLLAALAARALGVEAAITRMTLALGRGTMAAASAAISQVGRAVGEAALAMARGATAAGGFRVGLAALGAGGGAAFATLGTAAKAAGTAIMSAFGPVGWIIMGVTAAIQALIAQMDAARAKAEAMRDIQNEKADVLIDLGNQARKLTSEDERKRLLDDIQRRKLEVTSRATGAKTTYEEEAFGEYMSGLARMEEVVRRIGLNAATSSAVGGTSAEDAATSSAVGGTSAEDAAKAAQGESAERTKTRESAATDLKKWREDQELESAETPEEKRRILMARSGFGDIAGMDARINELGKLLSLGNASTTNDEAAELARLTGIRGEVGRIDRDQAKKQQAEAQGEVDEKARKLAAIQGQPPPRVNVWADAARSLGLGGSAASNGDEVAKIQAKRANEANSLLKDIRELLRKNPKLTQPADLVFN